MQVHHSRRIHTTAVVIADIRKDAVPEVLELLLLQQLFPDIQLKLVGIAACLFLIFPRQKYPAFLTHIISLGLE